MKYLLVFVLLIGSLSLSAEAPDWFRTGRLPGYSSNDFFVGVGEGSSYDQAQANAQANIGTQLRVTVQATLEVFTRESQINDDVDFSEDIERKTTTSVEETIQGVEIVEREKIGDRYYAFAALNKSRFFSGLQNELTGIHQEVNNSLQQAREDLNSGMIHAAVENYTEAYDKTLEYFAKQGFLQGLGGTAYLHEETISTADILAEIRRMLSSIEIAVLSGNNQQAEIGAYLPEDVTFIVRYLDPEGTEIPIPNMQVVVRDAENNLIERVATDSQGTVEIPVRAVPTEADRGSARAEIDVRNLATAFRSFLRRPETVVRYRIEKSEPIAVSIRITAENGERLDRVEQNVARQLTRLGFTTKEDAPFVIVGSAAKVDEQKVDGIRGSQYLVNVEISLHLSVAETGERISSTHLTGNGLSPRSPSAALQTAYQQISASRRAMTDLTSGVESKWQEIRQ